MRHPSFALTVVGICGLLTGCALCAHPYDYTGPVIPNEPGEGMMGFDERAGSILSGPMNATIDEGDVYDANVSEGGPRGEPTLAPVIEPQSAGYTSRRVTTQVVR